MTILEHTPFWKNPNVVQKGLRGVILQSDDDNFQRPEVLIQPDRV